MPVQGALKVDTIAIAQVQVDFLQNPVKVHALAGLASSVSGQTLAWASGDGGVWSEETMRKLRELCTSMEEDLGRRLLVDGAEPREVRAQAPSGIAEHLGENADSDAPSI